MAIANQMLGPAQFSVGGVLNDSFVELFRRFGFYMLIALIFTIPTLALSFIVPIGQTATPQTPEEVNAFIAAIVIFAILSMLSYILLYAAIIYAAAEGRLGRDPGVGETIAAAFGRGLYMTPTAILQALVVTIGLVLLVVPGIVAILYLFVAGPSSVMERAWPISSFRRSAALTKGYRWSLLGLLLIFVLILIMVGAITGVVTLLVVGIDGMVEGATLDPFGPQMMIATAINTAIQLPFTALGPVLSAVTYVALTTEKDGANPTTVSTVFE